MNIHEYQAKELLRLYKVATPDGKVAQDAEEARMITKEYGGASVVKAQIHAGGRGKGGGVKFANDPDKAADLFKAIFGMQLVTKQTGAEGRKVHTVFISKPVDIARELYLSFLVDRGSSRVTILASTEGGVEIEEVAEKTPEKIVKVAVDPALGLSGFQARQVAFALGLEGDTFKQGVVFLQNLYRLFMEKDCSMVEINPLVITKTGEVTALDAKIGFDDNALFRHPDILAFRDLNEEAEEEIAASKFNLNFIKLDGQIGCMVNGAGLAMGTMDIIKYHGGSPANFLDVGGGATEDAVKNAFRIILQDPAVKAVLVNIFGGIMRCDVVAAGIVNAAKEIGIQVPVVVRLEGTNVEEGKKILAESGLNLIVAADLKDAAEKVVASIK
ncbi:MAG: ADP-forming succinate--CoA ligase subunit beta [Geothrix sp.]|jgi:succinyl-CoA synthetase beta subunit|uniref:Succinate--CoA ligase [ADP-forming] subunit beta n=1 Tax=Candidatus Geothrix odensensis TaxID=2954440 RepID=A0A936EZK1_9BACT|nr:ADP-forming succinate--CoA ligase subunit beta [Candidatus Geothrix odensensis]MBK8790870.1 ADP-forming succinate--CoA ligase subunit beta [Holophagaceae bacterium]MBP7617449.1 ADP-forming succinate--CoA ligase subunit beta [Geothrix sp.]MCC6514229.1 ADP-forming succinate--CoA ligase subunit beta [Geothrix sp.]